MPETRLQTQANSKVELPASVVIIGAGPAGLTAALQLSRLSPETKVTVLEESDTVGGISRTVNHHGNRMDIGGHRFFSKDPKVLEWWSELLPMQGAPAIDDRILNRQVPLAPGGPDPEKTNRVMLSRHRISRIFYRRRFFDYPISLSANTLRNLGPVLLIKAGISYLYSMLHKLPEDSLENFYINRFGRVLYSLFFEAYTEKVWGRHPSKLSADWGSQRVKGLSVRAVLKDMVSKVFRHGAEGDAAQTETSLIERFSYPKYGPGQIWQQAADLFTHHGGEILFDTRATGLETQGQRVRGVYAVRQGQKLFYPADAVISTMPLKDLVAGMPCVPKEVADIAAGLPYRDFVTVGVLVERLLLKNTTALRTLGDIVPDNWIYVQDGDVPLGRIQVFNNWSPYMVADPQHTVWLGLEYFCNEGEEAWKRSDEAWFARAQKDLVQMGVLDKETPFMDAHCERVKKAYPAYFDTYEQMPALRRWLDGFTNLYCIGRNGQHRYNNMDHSMLTAFTAVDLMLSGETDKAALWSVNTEKEYHEQKG